MPKDYLTSFTSSTVKLQYQLLITVRLAIFLWLLTLARSLSKMSKTELDIRGSGTKGSAGASVCDSSNNKNLLITGEERKAPTNPVITPAQTMAVNFCPPVSCTQFCIVIVFLLLLMLISL